MRDETKTKKQLINELVELRKQTEKLKNIADRKKTEEKLYASEKKFRTLFNSANDAIAIHDIDGHFLEVNETICKRLGYSYEELINMTPMDIDTSENAARVRERIEELLQRKYLIFETAHVCRDGTVIPVEVSSRIIDYNGVPAVLSIARDITERKNAEEKLLLANERLNYLLSSTNAIIYTAKTSEDYGGTFISENIKQMTGHEPQQFISDSSFWFNHIHPEDQPKVEEEIYKLFEKKYLHCEYRFQRQDGAYIWVRDEMKLVQDEKNNPLEIIGFWIDITERKKVEEELRESEKHYRETLDALGDWILAVDRDLRIMIFNKAFKQINKELGLATDVIGRTPIEIFPFLPPSLLDEYQWVFENKKNLITEEITKVGDREFVTESRKIPLLKDGEIIKIVSVMRDITDKKRLETSLLQAQKMESVGQLAGGVAHDFNNLLTAIIGFGNLLKTAVSQNDLLMNYVTQILNSAERATNLTHSLLSFSRRQMINPRPVNVNNIINSMKSFIQRIIGEDIEFSILLSSKNLTVMADKPQIEQVLMNLATNARDAMPDGGNLIIRTEYSEIDKEFIKKHGYFSTGSYALISVKDTGQGMDEETKERIFDPFYTTKEVGKGTGLGLSMVYGIVKQHNGYINVQTELGKGTIFNVYLPLTIATVEEDKKPKDLTTLKGGNETILVAEDETYVRDFIKEILTGYGYKVLEAIDGEDAIKVLYTHKDKIQLAMLDVIMPKKDGKMVYEEIKKISPNMKVIFISGYATDILFKRGIIEAGIKFISKPMSHGELLIKVREALDS